MPITPNADQFARLVAAPDDGPVVMLNLLKYTARTDEAGESGAAAYRRYGEAAVRMIAERGGTVLWAGTADEVLIGDPAEDWDTVVLVQYPSRAAFVDMVSKPEYRKAHEHREAGLERTIVIACTPRTDTIVTEGN